MQRLSNLDVYNRLLAVEKDLAAMADAAMSPSGATALRAVSAVVRRLASAFFKAAF